MRVSGKLVIVGIIALALAASGTSWWFRYAATHKTVKLFGPEAARLIRDARNITLFELEPAALASIGSVADRIEHRSGGQDISKLPGITHLRNALLEDRSYDWTIAPKAATTAWKWGLLFDSERTSESTTLLFSADWQTMAHADSVVSCRPIAGGLQTMLRPPSSVQSPER